MRSRRSAAARRSLDPPVRAALRLGAYQLGFVDGVARYAAVNESVELVRRRGLERAVAFTNAVLRRLADGIRALLESLPEATPAEAALKHSYPDWVAETWWRDLGPDEAVALMRAQNEPADASSGSSAARSTDAGPGRSRAPGTSSASTSAPGRGPDLAPERGVAARRARRRRARGRADARPLRGARRQGDDARAGRSSPSRSTRRGRASSRRRRAGSAHRTSASSSPTAARFPRAHGLRPRARRRAVLRARRPQPPPRPPLARRAAPGAPARAPAARPPSASGREARSSTRSARSTRTSPRRRRCVGARGRPDARRRVAAVPPPAAPEFLQTLPHVHGTAGFFVARLTCAEDPSRASSTCVPSQPRRSSHCPGDRRRLPAAGALRSSLRSARTSSHVVTEPAFRRIRRPEARALRRERARADDEPRLGRSAPRTCRRGAPGSRALVADRSRAPVDVEGDVEQRPLERRLALGVPGAPTPAQRAAHVARSWRRLELPDRLGARGTSPRSRLPRRASASHELRPDQAELVEQDFHGGDVLARARAVARPTRADSSGLAVDARRRSRAAAGCSASGATNDGACRSAPRARARPRPRAHTSAGAAPTRTRASCSQASEVEAR